MPQPARRGSPRYLRFLLTGALLGLAVTVVAIARWIGQARAEIAELPLEHEH